jgi:hypothetical protein
MVLPRDSSKINNLAKQVHPGDVKYMQEAFNNATAKPHGYLFYDVKPQIPEDFRLRTNVFPE